MTMTSGRTVWHDPRSWNYSAPTAPLKNVKWASSRLLNQSDVNACTSFAFANTMNSSAFKLSLKESDALNLYAVGSIVDESVEDYWPREDNGLSSLGACKGAKRLGLITAYEWAFGIDHLLGAAMLKPFVVGGPLYEGMGKPDRDGFIHAKGNIVGGHAMTTLGINMDEEYIVFGNSWGMDWGTNGRARMFFEDVDILLRNQGDCVTVLR